MGIKRSIFLIIYLIERYFAYLLGKGYGAATIKQEVKAVASFLAPAHKRLLNKEAQVLLAIDVGGNVGDYSKELQNYFPGIEIHIFEPTEINHLKLIEIFKNNFLIHLNKLALSDTEGRAMLYSDVPGSGMGSLVNRRLDHFGISMECSEEIDTIRFETYWKRVLNRRTIDLVKLDIEGFELAALRGFGEAVESVRVIQFEFGGCNLDTRTNFQDFYYFFKDLGWLIYRITPLGLEEIRRYRELDEVYLTTNFIAVNSKLRQRE